MEQAACKGLNPYLQSEQDQKQILSLCYTCPVQRECLSLGFKSVSIDESGSPEAFHVYGGLLPKTQQVLYTKLKGDLSRLVCKSCYIDITGIEYVHLGEQCQMCS